MAFFNRRLYKHKPKAWGPVSAVQSSIFTNAERMGIDPTKHIAKWAFWENAGTTVTDYIQGKTLSLATGSMAWNNGGASLDRLGYLASPNIQAITPPFCVVMSLYMAKGYTQLDPGINESWYLCSHTDVTDGFWSFMSVYDAGIRFASNHGNIQYGKPSAGSHVIILRQQSATLANIYIDGVLAGAGNNGWVIGDTAPFRVESNAASSSTLTPFTWHGIDYINSNLTDAQIAYLSDNPYCLLQRVPSVYYSVPGVSGVTVQATLGAVAVTGLNPTISAGTNIAASTGSVTVAGLNPTVTQTTQINAALGTVAVTGLNPSVSVGTTIQATAGAVTVAGLNPTVSTGTTIDCTSGAVAVAALQPEVSVGTTVEATAGAVAVQSYPASITNGLAVDCTAGAVTVAALNPTVLAGTHVSVTAGAVAVQAYPVSVSLATTIECSVGAVAVAALNPAISVGTTIPVTVATVQAQAYPATITAGAAVEVGVGAVTVTGYPATITNALTIDATLGAVSVQSYPATVEATHLIDCSVGAVAVAAYACSIVLTEDIDVPDSRTFRVPAESRVFRVPAESRVLKA